MQPNDVGTAMKQRFAKEEAALMYYWNYSAAGREPAGRWRESLARRRQEARLEISIGGEWHSSASESFRG